MKLQHQDNSIKLLRIESDAIGQHLDAKATIRHTTPQQRGVLDNAARLQSYFKSLSQERHPKQAEPTIHFVNLLGAEQQNVQVKPTHAHAS